MPSEKAIARSFCYALFALLVSWSGVNNAWATDRSPLERRVIEAWGKRSSRAPSLHYSFSGTSVSMPGRYNNSLSARQRKGKDIPGQETAYPQKRSLSIDFKSGNFSVEEFDWLMNTDTSQMGFAHTRHCVLEGAYTLHNIDATGKKAGGTFLEYGVFGGPSTYIPSVANFYYGLFACHGFFVASDDGPFAVVNLKKLGDNGKTSCSTREEAGSVYVTIRHEPIRNYVFRTEFACDADNEYRPTRSSHYSKGRLMNEISYTYAGSAGTKDDYVSAITVNRYEFIRPHNLKGPYAMDVLTNDGFRLSTSGFDDSIFRIDPAEGAWCIDYRNMKLFRWHQEDIPLAWSAVPGP
ncbi:hypothetical protein Mal15_58510 [Stieleria maiorica]|uniref:Uncharacterized protein n=1 Tax=Stieleria maiorica TaxID=2795974 RepID=A0A5B9MKG8_9BACT|nr:hypothetical protein [Stieleria maiorica]QEG01772.1 hypothetical protein Mal15_58510 [Stieleria maiorica]